MEIVELKSFFPEADENSLMALVSDPDFIKTIPGLILKNVEKKEIFPASASALPIFFSRADFACDEEQIYVSQLFKNYFSFSNKTILPSAVDYVNEFKSAGDNMKRYGLTQDFASRCLFSLAMFSDALEKLNRKGAPDTDFYRALGRGCFESIERFDVATHFNDWEAFIRERAFS
jgi:hypothetical protein